MYATVYIYVTLHTYNVLLPYLDVYIYCVCIYIYASTYCMYKLHTDRQDREGTHVAVQVGI